MIRAYRWTIAIVGLGLSGVLAGCGLYAKDADKAACRTVDSGWKAALGSDANFDVAYRPFAPRAEEPSGAIQVGSKLIQIGAGEPQKLTLDECLQIAFRNSRSFQTRKETLYAQALDLASSRRDWNFTKFGGSLTGKASDQFTEPSTEAQAGSASGNLTWAEKLYDGGLITLGAGLDLSSDLLGWKSTTLGSLVQANFTQPLMRGAWRGLAYEEQYRKERDFLFAVFDYERFTQTFSADVVGRYYAVLQRRDQLENAKETIGRLRRTLTLTKVLVKGGQRSRVEQDQAEQRLLDAEVRYEADQQSYRDSLDEFKLFLGLPIRASVEVDYPDALAALNQAGPQAISLDEPNAIDLSLSARPDVLTQRAAARDAERDVDVAADAFLPQLDVALGISAQGTPPHFADRIRWAEHTRKAEVKFNYDLDQTLNRDKYRKAMIAMEKARRDLSEFTDKVRMEVRQSYRSLMQSRKTYELQLRSVELAKRRQKLAVLEQTAGQASARDVLDADEALSTAQNGLTTALVNYTTTRMRFLASLGMVVVDGNGRVRERSVPQKFDRMERPYPYVAGK